MWNDLKSVEELQCSIASQNENYPRGKRHAAVSSIYETYLDFRAVT
ncbi:hypothetical protein PRJ39_18030 [Lysobacter enzymogenes]